MKSNYQNNYDSPELLFLETRTGAVICTSYPGEIPGDILPGEWL